MMKRLPFLATLLGLLTGLAASGRAAAVAADSHLAAVTVYLDRAVVSRTAGLDLAAAGPVELTFEKLPAALLDQSLQVTGQGSAEATLLDVTARPTFVDFTPNARVKALEDDLRALNRDDRTLADRITVLGQQRDYVFKIQNATTTPPKDAPATPPNPAAWLPLLAFSEDQLAKIAAELQSAELQREDLQVKRTALEQQLAELRGEGGRSYKTVTVRLAAAGAGHLEVTLRYTVPGASWTPSYDARAASGRPAVELSYFGLVRQNTGEDWKAVDLTLSTARPALGGASPELSPWIVQQREIRPMRPDPAATVLGSLAFDSGAGEKFKSASAPRALALRQMDASVTMVETQATSATFRIAGRNDIPSDNAPHKVGIAKTSLAADLAYRATPKLDPTAFLGAQVTNTSDYPFLAGNVSVFLDDTFVATSALRTVMPGEKFDLALGADDAITVKRKLVNRFAEDTGVVNKGRRLTYDILLSVQNNKKAPATVTLLDQIPVSRHEKIVVKLLAPEARDLKPDADGTLTWKLTLAPGEKREIPLKFSLEYPNDLPVAGVE